MHQSIPAVPIPPRAFACLVSPGGGELANLAQPGDRAFAYLGAIPGLLTRMWFPTQNPNTEGPVVHRRLVRLPKLRTRQPCGGFLDFMHFFIAYQGTFITIYTKIRNDQRESTYACFVDQGLT